jgi:hypothetical protein
VGSSGRLQGPESLCYVPKPTERAATAGNSNPCTSMVHTERLDTSLQTLVRTRRKAEAGNFNMLKEDKELFVRAVLTLEAVSHSDHW